MGTELDALLPNLAEAVQAEYLKTAAVGKNGPRPGGKAVQSSMPGHKFIPRTQIKMVGIAKNYGRTNGSQIIRGNSLYRTNSSYWHENGSLYISMSRVNDARTGRAVLI